MLALFSLIVASALLVIPIVLAIEVASVWLLALIITFPIALLFYICGVEMFLK